LEKKLNGKHGEGLREKKNPAKKKHWRRRKTVLQKENMEYLVKDFHGEEDERRGNYNTKKGEERSKEET